MSNNNNPPFDKQNTTTNSNIPMVGRIAPNFPNASQFPFIRTCPVPALRPGMIPPQQMVDHRMFTNKFVAYNPALNEQNGIPHPMMGHIGHHAMNPYVSNFNMPYSYPVGAVKRQPISYPESKELDNVALSVNTVSEHLKEPTSLKALSQKCSVEDNPSNRQENSSKQKQAISKKSDSHIIKEKRIRKAPKIKNYDFLNEEQPRAKREYKKKPKEQKNIDNASISSSKKEVYVGSLLDKYPQKKNIFDKKVTLIQRQTGDCCENPPLKSKQSHGIIRVGRTYQSNIPDLIVDEKQLTWQRRQKKFDLLKRQLLSVQL